MSSNNDETNNRAPGRSTRGRRGVRPPRGRGFGRSYSLTANAHIALTQHLLRRTHTQKPALSDPISRLLGSFHTAPLNARRVDPNVYPTPTDRESVLANPIYYHHPSARLDLQSPLALNPISPAHSPVLIDNYYITGTHSGHDPNTSSYKLTMFLHNLDDPATVIKPLLTQQLTDMQNAGFPTSTQGLDSVQIIAYDTYPADPEIDDEPITGTTDVLPPSLATCSYAFKISLPTYSPSAYGLLLLSSRQAKWTANIPTHLIPQNLHTDTRSAILQQIPTVSRTATNPPKLSRDQCTITCTSFAAHLPTESLRYFRASAIHTLHKLLTSSEYQYLHETATSIAQLSPPVQSLLQCLDAIQPANRWKPDERPNTVQFVPAEVDYNPIRQQSMPF